MSLGQMAFDIRVNVIVHSKAFSHAKIARDLAKVVNGIVLGYGEVYDVYNQNVIVVSTIDYIDISLSSPFIIPSRKCIYYGVAEGIPVLTPSARCILDNCVVVVPSMFVKRCVEKIGIRVHDVIPHAVNIPDPDPAEVALIRGKLYVDHGCRYVVGWIGANQIRKGLDIAFEIGEMLPKDVCLVLITGDGEEEIPSDLPRNVVYMEKVFKIDNISNYMCAFDVFLNTSRSEGFGLPVFEALSLGRKVVVPSIPVFKEYLDGVKGVFFYDVRRPRYELYKNYMWMEYYDPKSIDDIVEKIMEALRSDDEVDSDYIRRKFNLKIYERFRKWL